MFMAEKASKAGTKEVGLAKKTAQQEKVGLTMHSIKTRIMSPDDVPLCIENKRN